MRPFLVGRMALRWRLGGPVMPERFTSGLYGPELIAEKLLQREEDKRGWEEDR